MKGKFFLILALIAVSNCEVNEDDWFLNEFYPVVIGFFKGMSKKTAPKCASVFSDNAEKIKGWVKEAQQRIKQGEEAKDVLTEIALRFVELRYFVVYCRALSWPELIDRIKTKEGFKGILKRLIDNYDQVGDQVIKIEGLLKEKNYIGLGEVFGKIFAIGTDFYVNSKRDSQNI